MIKISGSDRFIERMEKVLRTRYKSELEKRKLNKEDRNES